MSQLLCSDAGPETLKGTRAWCCCLVQGPTCCVFTAFVFYFCPDGSACVRVFLCCSITELTNRGVCFPLTGQTRRETQASFTAERPKGPVVIRQKLCSCSEESLSFNVFIGTSLSPFLLSSKHEKPWLVLSFSCVLLKYFSKTLKSTSSGRFAIFITHCLSEMLVCPLDFST